MAVSLRRRFAMAFRNGGGSATSHSPHLVTAAFLWLTFSADPVNARGSAGEDAGRFGPWRSSAVEAVHPSACFGEMVLRHEVNRGAMR
jgi:hypothetical protein